MKIQLLAFILFGRTVAWRLSNLLFVRTSGNDGDARGLTCLIVPMDAEGV